MCIDNPLPQQYLTQGKGTGGVIKSQPDDFVVEEIPLYEPCGEGEHLYLRIEKTSVSHGELMSCLRRHFHVKEVNIGYAGMKDKAAITRQTVSIHLLDDPPSVEIDHERINVLWARRHTNKIHRGHLRGNRFSIRIREVDPLSITAVKRCLDQLQQTGMPNYFGFQRFGYRCNNQILGAAIVRKDWQAMLDELLGATGTPFPEYQRERRELYDQGRYTEAARDWAAANRNELIASRSLRGGKSLHGVCHAVGQTPLAFWISALQSAIFNRVLDERLQQGTLLTLVEGDLAWKHDSRSVFAVTAAEMEGDVLARRLERFEISPSGPLCGSGMTRAAGSVDVVEIRALQATGVPLDALMQVGYGVHGARRAMRVPIANVELDSGVDEGGNFIHLAFDLPRGAYATVLLREIMRTAIDETASFASG
jgi:tRNA pseudouridine13 synthase